MVMFRGLVRVQDLLSESLGFIEGMSRKQVILKSVYSSDLWDFGLDTTADAFFTMQGSEQLYNK